MDSLTIGFAPLVGEGGTVLDVACGAGRHTRRLLEQGYQVVAVDIDVAGVADHRDHPRAEIVEVDSEDGRAFPLGGRRFDGVVVTRYLHRPVLPDLVRAVAPGGVLVYETFARGNERFGRPTNPAFLLRQGELLDAVRGELRVLAYEDLIVDQPAPPAIQRVCARREP
ncbi:MAG: class I SAM-dependent methyltransferase [Egibacteraceae bacterium]